MQLARFVETYVHVVLLLLWHESDASSEIEDLRKEY